MLKVQEYLRPGKTLDDLNAELGIKAAHHPTLPLVIVNYNQIESPKTNPIVRECRGLVLETGTWDLVARSFPRFFNWGEVADEMPLFDFSDFIVQSKEDGSLVLIFNYKGQWLMNTRGSFAQDLMPFQEFTWQEAFLKALHVSDSRHVTTYLDPSFTYVCEFCSPWNKVVRRYEPTMYLLTAFQGEKELHWQIVDGMMKWFAEPIKGSIFLEDTFPPFQRPVMYQFKSIDEIEVFLREQAERDPTFEGVVIRDKDGRRWKIKNPTYLALHKMKGDGDNLFNPKYLLPFVLSGESAELLVYFPEVKDQYEALEAKVNVWYDELQALWLETKDIAVQKDFALAIKGRSPFTGILFQMRKLGHTDLRTEWQKSETMILKVVTG